jgi:DNA repair exonuclease SbcCD ATPase subunit
MADEHSGPLDLATARRELYAVKPAEFVSVRGGLAKRARSNGEKDLASQIQALRKPTLAAWLVNALARERPDDLNELLELGRDMREGMGGVDADGLRELTRRRHQLVAGLVSLARELGAANGQRVADEAARSVQTTLEATLSDADSADAVADGCLSEPLEPSGFGFGFGVGDDRPAPRVAASNESAATVTDIADRRARKEAEIADAEEGLADAEHLARQAERAYAEAQKQTADAARQADKASDKIDKLEAKLEEARAELAEQNQAATAARQTESDAEKTMRAATRALAAATERLRRLRR